MKPAFELYAVTGRPIGHSLSPEIYARLFRAFGRDAAYARLAADSAREALETARAIGMRGLNVTSPFKEEVVPFLDALEGSASRIGAVNCLTFGAPPRPAGPPDGASGWNTDHIGMARTLAAANVPVSGRRALVLGTGGAARAAAHGLANAGARVVTVAGRSTDKARAVARALGCDGASLDDALRTIREFDLCVSCLPFPASRLLHSLDLDGLPVLDAHYAGSAAAPGSALGDGALSWLFHQAVPSFEIFTGLRVPDGVVREVRRDFLAREPGRKPHVALVGFMGAGKTSVGRALAKLIGNEFLDTDEMVEAAAGLRIPEIFRSRGEGAFRTLERAAIEKTAGSPDGTPKVIAVGGGAVLDERSRSALAATCRVVWLWVPAPAALSRFDVATRPVLDPRRPAESAERVLAGRIPLYAAVAGLIVNAASGDPSRVARRIKDELDQAVAD